jgi:glyoxylase-like metal-dependent hydrolase (beta-lactamase superfamily II)
MNPTVSAPTHLTLGALEVSVLHDLTDAFPKTADLFPNLEPAQLAAFEARYPGVFGDDGVMQSPQTAFLVRDGTQVMLIDAGLGPRSPFSGRDGHLLERLQAHGLTPPDVTAVLLTHPHPDHVGWLLDTDGAPTFTNATHHLHRLDRSIAPPPAARALGRLEARGMLGLFDGEPSFGAVRALHTPGHTPGHTAYLVQHGQEGVLITGDAFVHPLNLEHPEWGTAFDMDAAQSVRTRKTLIETLKANGWWLAATHFAPQFGKVQLEDSVRTWR